MLLNDLKEEQKMNTKKESKILKTIEHYPILTVLVLFMLYFLCYNIVENLNPQNFLLIDTPVDHLIPFSKYASLPYMMWHLQMPVIVFFFYFKKDMENFWKVSIKLLAGLFIILLFSVIVPNQLDLRPAVVEGNDFFAWLARFIYTADDAQNVFPSGHAYGAAIMFFAWNKRITRPWEFYLNTLVNGAIVLSTMLMKQHSIIDVFGGVIMAFVIEGLAEIPELKKALPEIKLWLRQRKPVKKPAHTSIIKNIKPKN